MSASPSSCTARLLETHAAAAKQGRDVTIYEATVSANSVGCVMVVVETTTGGFSTQEPVLHGICNWCSGKLERSAMGRTRWCRNLRRGSSTAMASQRKNESEVLRETLEETVILEHSGDNHSRLDHR